MPRTFMAASANCGTTRANAPSCQPQTTHSTLLARKSQKSHSRLARARADEPGGGDRHRHGRPLHEVEQFHEDARGKAARNAVAPRRARLSDAAATAPPCEVRVGHGPAFARCGLAADAQATRNHQRSRMTRVKAPGAAGRLHCIPLRKTRIAMLALNLAPVVLASVLLAAHFHRAGSIVGVVAALALIALALVRRPWAARVVQLGLVAGAVEWLRTMAVFAAMRIAAGQPYLRLVAILAVVALATALAALVFERRPMRRRYGLHEDGLAFSR
jgi:hypothetical protein